jgi:hypothetical protein
MEWQSIIQSRHELNLDVQVQNSSIASHSSQQLPMTIHSCILFWLQQMNQLTFCSVQNKSQPSFQFSTTATTPKKYTEILFGRSIEKVNTNSTFFLYKTVNYKQHIKETICFCHPLQKRVYFQNISMLPHSATLVAGCIKYTTLFTVFQSCWFHSKIQTAPRHYAQHQIYELHLYTNKSFPHVLCTPNTRTQWTPKLTSMMTDETLTPRTTWGQWYPSVSKVQSRETPELTLMIGIDKAVLPFVRVHKSSCRAFPVSYDLCRATW